MNFAMKHAWIVKGNLEIFETNVVYDNDTKKVLFYQYENGSFEQMYFLSGAKIFFTQQEAEDYKNKRIVYLRDNMKAVCQYLRDMEKIEGKGYFEFKKSDYMPNDYNRELAERYYDDYCRVSEYVEKLETYIKSGMLNIDGRLIPHSEVERIDWYCKEDGDEGDYQDITAKLLLKGDVEVSTSSTNDVRLVVAVFGKNAGDFFIEDKKYDD